MPHRAVSGKLGAGRQEMAIAWWLERARAARAALNGVTTTDCQPRQVGRSSRPAGRSTPTVDGWPRGRDETRRDR